MHVLVGPAEHVAGLRHTGAVQLGHFVQLEPDLARLAEIPQGEIESALLFGGEWLHEAQREKLLAHGVPPEAIVTASEPSRWLEHLTTRGVRIEDRNHFGYSCIYHDLIERQWYAYPLIVAAAQAQRMGVFEVTVVELGVFTGVGLRNLASIGDFLAQTTGVRFRIFGFDTGAGLPSVADWRDHPELWQTGSFVMPDVEEVRRSLPPSCELIIGDIAQTMPPFVERLRAEAPLGFMALDVDTYSSSVAALKLFDGPAECYLPVVPTYVDDVNVNIMQTSFAGEGLAIRHFNDRSELRKIDQKIVRTDRPQKVWHHAMYFAHIFDHPLRASSGGTNFIGMNHFYF